MAEDSYLGRGMAFPPRVNPATGRFMTADGLQSVRESIYLILMTARGERWLDPSFGSNIMDYTFIDTSATILSIMKSDLTRTILEQEPRVSNVEVRIAPTENTGVLYIDIGYVVADGSTVDNIVFPFYLNAMNEDMPAGDEEELAGGAQYAGPQWEEEYDG